MYKPITFILDSSNIISYESSATFEVQSDMFCGDQHGKIFYTLTIEEYIIQRTLSSDWQYLEKFNKMKCSTMNCDENGNVFCTSENTVYTWSMETSSWTHVYDLSDQQFFKPLNNDHTQFIIAELSGFTLDYTINNYKPGRYREISI